MNFSKTTLADDFKLEIAQQSQCGKQDDVNFPKDLGSGNRNEQNETQFEKGGGRGRESREDIQTSENESLESMKYPVGRNLALAYGLVDPTLAATQCYNTKAQSECSVG